MLMCVSAMGTRGQRALSEWEPGLFVSGTLATPSALAPRSPATACDCSPDRSLPRGAPKSPRGTAFPCGSGREPVGPPRWNRCAWREWREAKVTQQRELANGHPGPWPRFPGAAGPCCSAKPRAMLFASAGSAPACQTTTLHGVLSPWMFYQAHVWVSASWWLPSIRTGRRERPPPSRAGHGLWPRTLATSPLPASSEESFQITRARVRV